MKTESIHKNGIWVISLRMTQILSGILNTAIIARSLSIDEFGIFNEIYAVLGIFIPLAMSGFSNLIYQKAAQKDFLHIKSILLLMFKYSFIGSFFLIIYAVYAFNHYSLDAFLSVIILAFSFPFCYGLDNWKGLHIGGENYRELGIYGLSNAVIRTMLLLFSAYFFSGDIWALIASTVLPIALQNISRSISAIKSLPIIHSEIESEDLRYGYKNTMFMLINSVSTNADKLILSTALSPSTLAIYAASEKLSDLGKTWISDWAGLYSAKFAREKGYEGSIANIINHNYFISLVIFTVAAFVVTPIAVPIIYGEKYNESIILSQISLLTLGFCSKAFFQSRFIQSNKDVTATKIITLYPLIAKLLLSVLLIPIFKIWGAVIALISYRIFSLIFAELAIRHMTKKGA